MPPEPEFLDVICLNNEKLFHNKKNVQIERQIAPSKSKKK